MVSEVPSSEPAAPTTAGAGQRLAAAREAKNLTPDQVAAELRLDVRMIEALERDDQEALPSAVFVRGYIRRYAALLDIDATELLAVSKPVEHVEIHVTPGTGQSYKRRLYVPQIPWRALGILILVGVIAAVLFTWGPELVDRVREGFTTQGDDSNRKLLLPGQDETPLMIPSEEVPAPVPPVMEEAPVPEQSAVPAELPLDEISLSVVEPAIERPPEKNRPTTVKVELDFHDDSWVEMSAGDGTRLLYGLLRKGQRREIEGQAPVSVVLGNSRAVDIRVDGSAVDMSQYNRSKVSRFQLEKHQQ